jgi:hypothetical protein
LTGITFLREDGQHQEKSMCNLEAHSFQMMSIDYDPATTTTNSSLCVGTFPKYAIILDTTFKLGRQQEKIIVHRVGLHDP